MSQKRIRYACFISLSLLLLTHIQPATGQSLTLLEWHESVTTDAIFAWKMTSADLVNESLESYMQGLLIQIKYIAEPPSDPSRIFNSTDTPDWSNIYINGFRINMDSLGEMGTAFTQFISPITFYFDNGTSFNLDEMERLDSPLEDVENYYTVENGFVNTTTVNETMRFTTFIKIVPGIAANISMDIEEVGSMFMEYFVPAANVDDTGKETKKSDEYTNFQDPSEWLKSVILLGAGVGGGLVLIAIIIIVQKRRS